MILKVWTVSVSLSATPPTPLIPFLSTSNGCGTHRFFPIIVLSRWMRLCFNYYMREERPLLSLPISIFTNVLNIFIFLRTNGPKHTFIKYLFDNLPQGVTEVEELYLNNSYHIGARITIWVLSLFCVVTSCRLAGKYQHFGETCRPHLRDWKWRQHVSPCLHVVTTHKNQYRHVHRRENLKSHIDSVLFRLQQSRTLKTLTGNLHTHIMNCHVLSLQNGN
jgi:hypothetical protein